MNLGLWKNNTYSELMNHHTSSKWCFRIEIYLWQSLHLLSALVERSELQLWTLRLALTFSLRPLAAQEFFSVENPTSAYSCSGHLRAHTHLFRKSSWNVMRLCQPTAERLWWCECDVLGTAILSLHLEMLFGEEASGVGMSLEAGFESILTFLSASCLQQLGVMS